MRLSLDQRELLREHLYCVGWRCGADHEVLEREGLITIHTTRFGSYSRLTEKGRAIAELRDNDGSAPVGSPSAPVPRRTAAVRTRAQSSEVSTAAELHSAVPNARASVRAGKRGPKTLPSPVPPTPAALPPKPTAEAQVTTTSKIATTRKHRNKAVTTAVTRNAAVLIAPPQREFAERSALVVATPNAVRIIVGKKATYYPLSLWSSLPSGNKTKVVTTAKLFSSRIVAASSADQEVL